ncbi:class B sortase [Collinsella provencensis]|uniref:class B sortase n=1 Tax=Collinsella provencensis TaxID=1937461 RepID=UPI001F25489D|nr:class B sortase [Collinsella provencensis]
MSGVNPVAGVTRGNVTNRSEKTRNAQRAGFMGSSNRSPYADTGSKRVPKKPKGKRDIISKVLLGIGLALLLIAGGLFVYARMGYKQASDYYNSIADDVLTDTGGIPEIDFAALKEISDDVVGWIYIPDTPVNYVVAQGESNETYLRHMLNGEYNQNGTVFMDVADTAPGMIDQQTTLYGHHMEDGSMFKFIDQTQDQKVFDTIDELYYITDGKTYVLKPLFTMVVEDTYLDARTPNFESIDEFHQYLNTSLGKARAKAKNASDRIDNVDHVMTLITCAGEIIPRTTRAGMVCEVVDSFEN